MTAADKRIDALLADAVVSLQEMRRLLPIVREHRLRCPEGGPGETSPVERRDEKAIVGALAAADQVRKAAKALRAQVPPPVTAQACRVCGRTAGPFRHGLDGRCRTRWVREGQPPVDAWVAEQRSVPPAATFAPSPEAQIRTVRSDAGRQGPAAAAS